MNIHLDNTQSSTYIAPVPKKKSPLSKITNFFINFFKRFLPSIKLSKEETTILKQSSYLFKKKATAPFPSSESTNPSRPASHRFSLPPFIQKNHDVVPFADYDPSLVAMRNFFSHFTSHVVECYYDKYFKRSTENMSGQAVLLQEYLRVGAILVVQLGNKTSKIVDDLKKNTTRIEEMVTKNRSEIDSSLEQIFHWLIEGETKESIFTHSLVRLNEIAIPPNQNLKEHYLSPILDWIFNPTHTNAQVKAAKENHAKTFDDVLQEIVVLLLEKKIDSYLNLMVATMGEKKLPQLVQASLSQVSKKVSDICSNQLAHLISRTDYPKAYDRVFNQLSDHVASLIQVKERAEAELDKASIEDKALLKKNSRKKKLARIEKHFAKDDKVCHPTITSIISSRKKGLVNPSSFNEIKFYSSVTERLLELICPSKVMYSPEGFIIERDGIVDLFYQAVPAIPEEFKTLIDKGISVFQQIIPAEALRHAEKAKGHTVASIERVILSVAKKFVREKMIEIMRDIVNRLVNPEQRTALMAQHIVPQINDFLLLQYMQSFFSSPTSIQVIAEELETTQENEVQLVNLKALLLDLFEKNTSQQRKELEEKFKIGSQQFNEICEELVTDILAERQKNPDLLAIDCLNKYFEFSDVPPKDIYGDLIMNLVFKMGKLSFLLGIGSSLAQQFSSTINEKINGLVTTALHSFSSSHQKGVAMIIQATEKTYGTTEQVNDLLFAPTEPLLKEENKQKLTQQFALAAFLTHALVKQNMVTGVGIVVPAAQEIQNAITRTYNTFFESELTTKSLLFNLFEIALNALSEAKATIQSEQDVEKAKTISSKKDDVVLDRNPEETKDK